MEVKVKYLIQGSDKSYKNFPQIQLGAFVYKDTMNFLWRIDYYVTILRHSGQRVMNIDLGFFDSFYDLLFYMNIDPKRVIKGIPY